MFDPEELEHELDTARASRDHLKQIRLKNLNMMRLPSCFMALTVHEMGPVRQCLSLCARQFAICSRALPDSGCFWFFLTNAQDVRKQVAAGIAAWVSVKFRDSVAREHLREVLALSPVQRELGENVTEFLNVVIGTFDGNHVFPADITFEGTELLAAMHLTAAFPTAVDWIDFFFRRREVMRNNTRRACSCSQVRWRSTSAKLSCLS